MSPKYTSMSSLEDQATNATMTAIQKIQPSAYDFAKPNGASSGNVHGGLNNMIGIDCSNPSAFSMRKTSPREYGSLPDMRRCAAVQYSTKSWIGCSSAKIAVAVSTQTPSTVMGTMERFRAGGAPARTIGFETEFICSAIHWSSYSKCSRRATRRACFCKPEYCLFSSLYPYASRLSAASAKTPIGGCH